VMAAGNANDHRRTIRERSLIDAVVTGEVRRIDLLRLTVGTGSDARTHYAHSYIGVGLTPVVAVDLEKGGKGSLREIVSVVRTFARFRPFPIELEDGSRRSVDSLVFANINQMAKYATVSDAGRPDDGRFEEITLPHTAKWRILAVAIRAATTGLGPQPTATRYGFTTLGPTPPPAGRGGPRTGRRDPRVRRGRPSGTQDDQLTGSATVGVHVTWVRTSRACARRSSSAFGCPARCRSNASWKAPSNTA
jgi:hypothetical protein